MVLLALLVAQPTLTVTNIAAVDTFRSQVAIVRGTSTANQVRIGRNGGSSVTIPVVDGKFSAPIELRPGSNAIEARAGKETIEKTIIHRPAKSDFRVRVVYLQASDEPNPTMMEVPGSNKADVTARISTSIKLMQGFCEDHFRTVERQGKTFTVDTTADGTVKIDFVKLNETGAALRAKTGNDLWSQFYGQLSKVYPFENEKILAIMGFTRYDVATQTVTGHTALGGGSLGLFGSGTIRYWPRSVVESYRAFHDNTPVQAKTSFNDSGNRHRAWANASTAIGAMTHEMGHTFGLPHTNDPRCIMSRGFDQFSAALYGTEVNPSNGAPVGRAGSYWDSVHTARLSLSPHFQPDRTLTQKPVAPTITRSGETIRLRAEDGLRLICVWQDGKANWSKTLRVKEATYRLKELRSKINGDHIQVVAMSASGGELTQGFDD